MAERFVTVIVTTRDRVEMLESVITSYLQPCVAVLIIVDDGSRDVDAATATAWEALDPRIQVVRHQDALGQPASRNDGLARAQSPFVFMSEDDVEIPPGYLQHLVDVMDEHRAVIAGTGMRYLSFSDRDDPDRWSGVSSPLPSMSMGPEVADEIAPGVFSVSHVHGVFMMCRQGNEDARFLTEYRGNAYREETDFHIRIAGTGGLVVGDTSRYFIHYRRPEHIVRTGNSAMGLLAYEYWAIRNNWVFLRRNRADLQGRGILVGSITAAQTRFILARFETFARARYRTVVPRKSGGRS